jgi:Sec-independent protein secretion pathway component TatC
MTVEDTQPLISHLIELRTRLLRHHQYSGDFPLSGVVL